MIFLVQFVYLFISAEPLIGPGSTQNTLIKLEALFSMELEENGNFWGGCGSIILPFLTMEMYSSCWKETDLHFPGLRLP